MIRSLMFGVAGLKSHQTRMDVIGNNLSNINTTGFKAGRVTFSDMLSQTQLGASKPNKGLGGVNPKQIGSGMGIETVDRILNDGALMNTGLNTDLAISGNGFFAVNQNGETYYTRNGAFSFDANGNYTLPGMGGFVSGWAASNGVIDTTTLPGKINVNPGKIMEPASTKTIAYKNNLDANTPIITNLSLDDIYNHTFYVTSTDTDSYAVGDNVNANINNVAVTFNNGLTILNPTVDYKYDTDYSEYIVVTLEDGTYVYPTGGDGSVSYQVNREISGTVGELLVNTNIGYISPASDTTTVYDKSDASNLNALTITGGPTSSGTLYNYLLSDGSTLTVDVGTYVIGATLDDPTNSGNLTPVSISKIDGYLSDGAVVVGVKSPCSMGKPLTSKVNDVYIEIYDSDGNVLESLSTGYKITPTSPVQCTNITLDTDMGDIVVSKDDPNTYTAESVYSAKIEKLDMKYSDDTTDTVTTEGNSYAIGQGKPVVTTAVVYDSLGGAHEIVLLFEKNPDGKSWKLLPGVTTVQDADGNIITVSMEETVVEFTSDGKVAPKTAPGILRLDYNNGADSQSISIDANSLTAYAAASTVAANTDGYTSGVCAKVIIDSSGIITSVYTNGERRAEGQVAIAKFPNASGLVEVKTGYYQTSNNSGSPIIGTAADLGVNITSGTLEMSNVNVADEFSEMITSQRGFSSNSKIITVSDDMLEQLNNLIR